MRPRSWVEDAQAIYPSMPARFLEGIACAKQQCFDHRYVLNVRPDPYDFRDLTYTPSLVAIKPDIAPPEWPARLVRRQGGEGACTGHALAAVIDIQHAKRSMASGKEFDPEAVKRVSARMLYEMARAHDDLPNDWLPGSSLRGALKGFFHNGGLRRSRSALCRPWSPAGSCRSIWRSQPGIAASAATTGSEALSMITMQP